MSAVNSLMLGGAATVYSLFRLGGDEKSQVKHLRIIVACFGAVCAIGAGVYPNLVQLTILASFVSLCLGPTIVMGLLCNKRMSDTIGALSIFIGLAALFISLPLMGLTAFLVGLLGAIIPFVALKCSKD